MKRSEWSKQVAGRFALIAALAWSGTALFDAGVASADPPPLVPIQGYLTDTASAPLDGTHQIRFRLYDSDTAVAALFEETLDVNVADGFFTIYLGDTVPLSLALFRDHSEIYLGIKVGTDAEAAPRLQIASTGFASLAAYCGDAETVGGLAPDDFQARVVGTCPGGQFMQSIDADGDVTCMAAPTETDPSVGAQTSGRWCTSDGSTVTCTANAPVLTEADPQVSALSAGSWCTSDGNTVSCAQAAPVLSESDPQVGVLTNARWCTSDGSAVICNTNPPILTEADPQVGTMSAGSWCTSDGSAVNCGQAAPVLSEADPQVGANTVSTVPRWDGSALVAGKITDTGALVGVNNASPNEELDVGGDVEVTGAYRFSAARTFNTNLGPSAFNPSTTADLNDWTKAPDGYGYMSDADGASTGQIIMLADANMPEGATISGVACSYQDESATAGIGYSITIPSAGSIPISAAFSLYRRNIASETAEVLANDTVSTTAAATNATPTSSGWSDNTILVGAELVDNTNYDYYLYVSWNVTDDTVSTLKFYGCRLTYTLTSVAFP